jgi:hypothetical protein
LPIVSFAPRRARTFSFRPPLLPSALSPIACRQRSPRSLRSLPQRRGIGDLVVDGIRERRGRTTVIAAHLDARHWAPSPRLSLRPCDESASAADCGTSPPSLRSPSQESPAPPLVVRKWRASGGQDATVVTRWLLTGSRGRAGRTFRTMHRRSSPTPRASNSGAANPDRRGLVSRLRWCSAARMWARPKV